MAGAAVTGLPAPHAVAERTALRPTLVGPQPGEVKQFPGAVGHRQDDVERAKLEGCGGRVVTGVGEGVAQSQHTLDREFEVGAHGHPGRGIRQKDRQGLCAGQRAAGGRRHARPHTARLNLGEAQIEGHAAAPTGPEPAHARTPAPARREGGQ